MRRDKILLQLDSTKEIGEYEKMGVTNFLFPLRGYSVGYDDFSFEEIESSQVDAYILANRLLTDKDIDEFLKLKIPHNVKGFVIEDTGLYYELKDKGYTLINFQNHLNANAETVNFWLEYYDSLVISTDITEAEIKTIVDESTKPLVLNALGYPMIMYSRRALVSNFYQNFSLGNKKEVTLGDPKGQFEFKLRETDYGTACFDSKILDARDLVDVLPDEKMLFYLINGARLDRESIKHAIEGEKIANATRGFLDKKTFFKVGDAK